MLLGISKVLFASFFPTTEYQYLPLSSQGYAHRPQQYSPRRERLAYRGANTLAWLEREPAARQCLRAGGCLCCKAQIDCFRGSSLRTTCVFQCQTTHDPKPRGLLRRNSL